MLQNATYLGAKTRQCAPNEYSCKTCDYTTSKTSDWKRHLKTKKHNATQMLDDAIYLGAKTRPTSWCCDCGKTYNHHSSFYRHKATCTYEPPTKAEQQNQIGSTIAPEHFMELLRENKELRELLAKQSSEVMGQMVNMAKTVADVAKVAGNNNTVLTNSHNTNINFYLNEHCKDAMSYKSLSSSYRLK